MVWRRYSEFNGRSQRAEYWMFALLITLAMIALCILGAIGLAINQDYGGVLFVPFGFYVLATIIPSLSVTVRRFHDTGKSGWMFLLLSVLGIIPLVGLVTSIIQLVITCTDSEVGTNEYGPSPKYPDLSPTGSFIPTIGTYSPPQPQPPASQNEYVSCRNCGQMLYRSASYCSSCGTHL